MRVTVVVPAYNAEKYIAETLKSIQAQSFTDWVAIIVNDGSTDRTRQIIEHFLQADSRFQIINQPNSGLASARNTGLKAAPVESDFVTVLDADDLWLLETLAILVNKLDNHPDWISVNGIARFVDATGNPIRDGELESNCRNGIDAENSHTFESLLERNNIYAGTILLRREAFALGGYFDESFHAVEDWELWLRLSRRALMGFVDSLVMEYRRHDKNMTLESDRMRNAERQLRNKIASDPTISDREKEISETAWRKKLSDMRTFHLRWARHHLRHGRFKNAFDSFKAALIWTQ